MKKDCLGSKIKDLRESRKMTKPTVYDTVKMMVEILKKTKPYEPVNVYSLYMSAIKLIDKPHFDDTCFYLEFHDERRRNKVRIRHLNTKSEVCTGLPQNVDYFYRLPTEEDLAAEYKIVREEYHNKYGYYADEIHICDMMLRSTSALLKATKKSLKRGTPLKTNETHVKAWNR